MCFATATKELRAAQVAAEEAALRASLARVRADRERGAAKDALQSVERSTDRSADVRAHAEHLRKLCNQLLARRAHEREAALGSPSEFSSSPQGSTQASPGFQRRLTPLPPATPLPDELGGVCSETDEGALRVARAVQAAKADRALLTSAGRQSLIE